MKLIKANGKTAWRKSLATMLALALVFFMYPATLAYSEENVSEGNAKQSIMEQLGNEDKAEQDKGAGDSNAPEEAQDQTGTQEEIDTDSGADDDAVTEDVIDENPVTLEDDENILDSESDEQLAENDADAKADLASEAGEVATTFDLKEGGGFEPGTYTITANLSMPGEYNPVLTGVTVYANSPDNPFGPTIDENDPAEAKGAVPMNPLTMNATLIVVEDGSKFLYLPLKNPIFTTQSLGSCAELTDVRVERTYPTVGSETGLWEGSYNNRESRIHKMLAALTDDLNEGTKSYHFKGSVLYAVPLDLELVPSGDIALELKVEYDSAVKTSDSIGLPSLSETTVGPQPVIDGAAPIVNENLIYTGTEQAGVEEAEHYALSGDFAATSVGDYQAVATLKDGYVWADGGSDPITIEWSIAKASLTAKYVSETIALGDEPALEVRVEGFVEGEDALSATGYSAPSVAAPTTLEEGKTYELTPEGGTADNYSFRYVSGTLKVGEQKSDDPKLAPGTYTITANPYIPGSENIVVSGLQVYFASPVFPPAVPASLNASLTVTEDGKYLLTVPLTNMAADIFTLQSIESGEDLTITNIVKTTGEYGPGITERIQEFTVELGNTSGEYQFGACSQYPTVIQKLTNMPVHLSVDFSGAQKQYEDPEDTQQSWEKTYIDDVSGARITVVTTEESVGSKLEQAVFDVATHVGSDQSTLQAVFDELYSTPPQFDLYTLSLKHNGEEVALIGNTKLTVSFATSAEKYADVYLVQDEQVPSRLLLTSFSEGRISFDKVSAEVMLGTYATINTDTCYRWEGKTWDDLDTDISVHTKVSHYVDRKSGVDGVVDTFKVWKLILGIDTESNELGTIYNIGISSVLGGSAYLAFTDENNNDHLESQVTVSMPAEEGSSIYLITDNGTSIVSEKLASTYADGRLTVQLFKQGEIGSDMQERILDPLYRGSMGETPTTRSPIAYFLVAADGGIKLASMPYVRAGTIEGLVYSGLEQSLVPGEHCTVEGVTSAVSAGTYSVTATPDQGYTWPDGTTSPKEMSWTIKKKTLRASISSLGSINYGETPLFDIDISGFVNGETAETAAGFSAPTPAIPELLEAGKKYIVPLNEDGRADNYAFSYSSGARVCVNPEVPQSVELSYTGVEQVGIPESDAYTLTDTAKAVDAGDYTTTATLKSGFTWPDGSTDPVVVEWSIAKATLTASYIGETIGESDTPSLKVEVAGFLNGETAKTAKNYTAPTVLAPSSLVAGKTYTLTPEGGSASNYAFHYVSGELKVKTGDGGDGDTSLAPGTYTVTANLSMPGEYNPVISGLTVYANNPDNPFGPTIDENDPAEVHDAVPSNPLSLNATLVVADDGTKTLILPIKNPIFTTQEIGTCAELPNVTVSRKRPTVGSTTGLYEGSYANRTDRINRLVATLTDTLTKGKATYNFKGSVLYAVPLDLELAPDGDISLQLTIEYDSLVLVSTDPPEIDPVTPPEDDTPPDSGGGSGGGSGSGSTGGSGTVVYDGSTGRIAAGTYTVTANIWFEKADTGLPMNPHLTNSTFPPKDPVSKNATLRVDSAGRGLVTVPIVIQSRIMHIKSIDGLAIVDQSYSGQYLSSVTVDLGILNNTKDVIRKICTVNLLMGDLAATISGFTGNQSWRAQFEVRFSGVPNSGGGTIPASVLAMMNGQDISMSDEEMVKDAEIAALEDFKSTIGKNGSSSPKASTKSTRNSEAPVKNSAEGILWIPIGLVSAIAVIAGGFGIWYRFFRRKKA